MYASFSLDPKKTLKIKSLLKVTVSRGAMWGVRVSCFVWPEPSLGESEHWGREGWYNLNIPTPWGEATEWWLTGIRHSGLVLVDTSLFLARRGDVLSLSAPFSGCRPGRLCLVSAHSLRCLARASPHLSPPLVLGPGCFGVCSKAANQGSLASSLLDWGRCLLHYWWLIDWVVFWHQEWHIVTIRPGGNDCCLSPLLQARCSGLSLNTRKTIWARREETRQHRRQDVVVRSSAELESSPGTREMQPSVIWSSVLISVWSLTARVWPLPSTGAPAAPGQV